MEAWLSWLEHTVHIREVTGSSPVASTTRNLKDFSGCFFVFRSIVLAQSVAGNKRQDNAQHLRVVRDPFGETGRSFALQTTCTVALFLLLLVSATGSKVRSAPHTLCALCPSVTLHAPLSNASISAPLMSESCPSTTRNLKDFLGCFFVFRHDRACTKRSGKQKAR